MTRNTAFRCNIEKCTKESKYFVIEGWIFCIKNLRNTQIQKIRVKLSGNSKLSEYETTPRTDVSRVHALPFKNSGFKIYVPENEYFGSIDVIEGMIDSRWHRIPSPEFFAQGFMWLCSDPYISDVSLIHDIGNYETRIQGVHLKNYLKTLILKVRNREYPQKILGQILSTSFYQIGFDSAENFQTALSISERTFPLECEIFSRWHLSVHTAKVHCLLFYGSVANAKLTLQHLGKSRFFLKNDFFLYYNFCKSQLLLSLLYFIGGEREKCAATCSMVRDAAFEAASVVPKTYSMASEIRDIMLCAQQSIILSHQCGIRDGSLDYPEALSLRSVLAVSLRVKDPNIIESIGHNLRI